MKLRASLLPVIVIFLAIWAIGKLDNKEIVIYKNGGKGEIEIRTSAFKSDYYTKLYIENRCRDRWVYVWIDDIGPHEFFPTQRPVKKRVNGRPLDQSKVFRVDFGKSEIYAESYLETVYGWYLVGTTRRIIRIDSHLGWKGYGETVIFNDRSFKECYVRRAPPLPLE